MHRLHVRADYSPNAERPFAGDCGGFVGWRHRRWEWCAFNLFTQSWSSKSFRTSTGKTLPAFFLSWPSRVILVRFVFAQLENGFCRVDRMGEEERRAAKALGYSAARWESGVDAPAADKQ